MKHIYSVSAPTRVIITERDFMNPDTLNVHLLISLSALKSVTSGFLGSL